MPPPTTIRPARPEDARAVAAIWLAGWADGHLGHVPDELVAVRDEADFRTRAAARIDDVQVATVDGELAGFVMVHGDEVEQVYVSAEHRGAGVADALLGDAERRIRDAGYDSAWLAVVAGNARARRFYERRGWVDEGPITYAAPGPDGPIDVPAHRYAKALATPPRPVHAADGLEILDNEAEHRYEARLDGEPAGLIAYEPHDGWLLFDHTEVPAAFEGKGIGSRLAKAALDDVRARGLWLNPRCPFVASYIRRHPEYGDLVVGPRGPRGRS